MTRESKASVRSAAPLRRSAEGSSKVEDQAAEGALVWPMLPWMTYWAEVWGAWLGGFPGVSVASLKGKEERRQEDGLPWLPKVETMVIPLRRRTDPPGGAAARISMRMQIPPLSWLGGGNVIAIDTLVPRPVKSEAEPTPAQASNSKTDWS
jgi:hypothetical protein